MYIMTSTCDNNILLAVCLLNLITFLKYDKCELIWYWEGGSVKFGSRNRDN